MDAATTLSHVKVVEKKMIFGSFWNKKIDNLRETD
jgi:hypothetical protein